MNPQIKSYPASKALQPFIKCFISTSFKMRDSQIWVPADLRNQLFVIRRGQAVIKTRKRSYKQPRISIRGSMTEPLNVSFTGPVVEAFVIEFTEIGVASLLKHSVSEITNSFSDITEFCKPELVRFFQRQLHATDKEFINSFEAEFEQSEPSPKAQVIIRSLSIIKEKHGSVRVRELAERVNTHPKTLGRYFQTFTGLNVRDFLQLFRFHVASKEALIHGKVENTPYYDQPHFIREFTKYSGVSPSEARRIDNSWLKFILESDLF